MREMQENAKLNAKSSGRISDEKMIVLSSVCEKKVKIVVTTELPAMLSDRIGKMNPQAFGRTSHAKCMKRRTTQTHNNATGSYRFRILP